MFAALTSAPARARSHVSTAFLGRAPLALLAALAFAPGCRAPVHAKAERPIASPPPQHAADPTPAPTGALTFEQCFGMSAKFAAPSGHFLGWLSANEYLVYAELDATSASTGGASTKPSKRVCAVDLATGQRRALYDPQELERALVAAGIGAEDAAKLANAQRQDWSADRARILINAVDDLFTWAPGSAQAARLTHDEKEEVGEAFSPDARWVSFVRDWNLWLVPAAGGDARALTTAGHENLLHGRLDWVYQEEIYGRGNFGAYWWSPDSRRIAFLVLDESQVPTYTITDDRTTQPKFEHWRYPKAGAPNPKVELHVVDVDGGATRKVDLSAWKQDDLLISRVSWTPDGREVVMQLQDRVQSKIELAAADASTGALRTILVDKSKTFLEPVDGMEWIDDGARFVWPSERDGWRHLYLHERDGKLVRRLTEGEWEVDAVLGVDTARGCVWFVGDRDDVKGAQLYRVPLAGGSITRVTEGAGTHAPQMAPDFGHWYDFATSVASPGRAELRNADGTLVRELATIARGPADAVGFRDWKFVKVKTRDGFSMEGMLLEPANREAGKRYPVVCHTYSGPHSQTVVDRWQGFNGWWHQFLAQQGYGVWICDNRSASGRGLVSMDGVHKKLGVQELADLEDGLDWLTSLDWVDSDRIALWGWSYGGYMTAFALTHSKRFKCGIVGAPVTDWRNYDSIYTERYMGLPQENAAGYDASSVLTAAKDAHGKMLIVYGTIDENVHPQNSLQLAYALQNAGKEFELMPYPGNRHGVVQSAQRKHLYGLMTDFLRRSL